MEAGETRLIPKLRRIRHVERIIIRNLSDDGICFPIDCFYTLSTAKGDQLFFQSPLEEKTLNPSWESTDLSDITRSPMLALKTKFILRAYWRRKANDPIEALVPTNAAPLPRPAPSATPAPLPVSAPLAISTVATGPRWAPGSFMPPSTSVLEAKSSCGPSGSPSSPPLPVATSVSPTTPSSAETAFIESMGSPMSSSRQGGGGGGGGGGATKAPATTPLWSDSSSAAAATTTVPAVSPSSIEPPISASFLPGHKSALTKELALYGTSVQPTAAIPYGTSLLSTGSSLLVDGEGAPMTMTMTMMSSPASPTVGPATPSPLAPRVNLSWEVRREKEQQSALEALARRAWLPARTRHVMAAAQQQEEEEEEEETKTKSKTTKKKTAMAVEAVEAGDATTTTTTTAATTTATAVGEIIPDMYDSLVLERVVNVRSLRRIHDRQLSSLPPLPSNSVLLLLTDGVYTLKETAELITKPQPSRGFARDAAAKTFHKKIDLSAVLLQSAKLFDVMQRIRRKEAENEHMSKLIGQPVESASSALREHLAREARRRRLTELKAKVEAGEASLRAEREGLALLRANASARLSHLSSMAATVRGLKDTAVSRMSEAAKLSKTTLLIATLKLDARRRKLVSRLLQIYPIRPPRGMEKYHFIRELPLPVTAAAAAAALKTDKTVDKDRLATALGYAGHLVLLLSKIYQVSSRYRVHFMASRSSMSDDANAVEVPLYLDSTDPQRFEYALVLLNKCIEQLLDARVPGWPSMIQSAQHTLANLYILLSSELPTLSPPPAPSSSATMMSAHGKP